MRLLYNIPWGGVVNSLGGLGVGDDFLGVNFLGDVLGVNFLGVTDFSAVCALELRVICVPNFLGVKVVEDILFLVSGCCS